MYQLFARGFKIKVPCVHAANFSKRDGKPEIKEIISLLLRPEECKDAVTEKRMSGR